MSGIDWNCDIDVSLFLDLCVLVLTDRAHVPMKMSRYPWPVWAVPTVLPR